MPMIVKACPMAVAISSQVPATELQLMLPSREPTPAAGSLTTLVLVERRTRVFRR